MYQALPLTMAILVVPLSVLPVGGWKRERFTNDNDDKFTSSDWTNLHALARDSDQCCVCHQSSTGPRVTMLMWRQRWEVDRIGDYTWTQQVQFRDWATFLQVPDQFHPNDLYS